MPKSALASKTRTSTSLVPQSKASRPAAELPVTDGSLDGALEPEGAAEPTFRVLPAHEEIAQRAYAIAQSRSESGQPGDDLSDWLQAEREILKERVD